MKLIFLIQLFKFSIDGNKIKILFSKGKLIRAEGSKSRGQIFSFLALFVRALSALFSVILSGGGREDEKYGI